MTTPCTRAPVSLAVALSLALTLGGCAAASSRLADGEGAASESTASVVPFHNEGRIAVRVYLIDDRHQWMLGRVEAGARALLRIPVDATGENVSWMRIAVTDGGPLGSGTARDGRTVTAETQPLAMILSQQWAFSQTFAGGQVTSLQLARAGGLRRSR